VAKMAIVDGSLVRYYKPDHNVLDPDNCISNVVQDAVRHVAYLAGVMDAGDEYELVAIRLSDLRKLADIRLGKAIGPPTIVRDDSDNRLFVSITRPDGSDHLFQVFLPLTDAEELVRQTSENSQFPGLVDEHPYILKSDVIVDGERILDERGNLIRRVSGDSLQSPELLSFYTSVHDSHLPANVLGADFADSAAGKMLFIVGDDFMDGEMPVGKSGLLIYDLRSVTVTTTFIAKSNTGTDILLQGATTRLSPDGDTLILDQYSWKAADESMPEGENNSFIRYRTGTFYIYDTVSGTLLHTAELGTKAAGTGSPLGISPDGRFMALPTAGEIAIVDLKEDRTTQIQLPPNMNPVASIFSK
jgi:hypothetical protein